MSQALEIEARVACWLVCCAGLPTFITRHGDSADKYASCCDAGMGTGLVYLNNLGQMVRALHGHGSAAVYISIFSVSSCAGRLLLGCAPSSPFLTLDHSAVQLTTM